MSDSTTVVSSSATAAAASDSGSAASQDWAKQWTSQIQIEEELQTNGRFSFEQVARLLSTLRTKLSQYAWRSVAKPRARAYVDKSTGRSRVRVYYLVANDFLGQTLWCVDVDPANLSAASEQNPDDVTSSALPTNNVSKRLLNLASINSQIVSGGSRGLSREEELLQERKRSFSTGIVDYDLDASSGTIVFACQNFVFHLIDNLSANQDEELNPIGIEVPHSPLNLALCPQNTRIAAYAADRNVYCISLDSGQIVAACDLSNSSKSISAGLPPFAVQEEFDRFHGFWWRPASNCSTDSASFDLIVEIVDESQVQSINIVDPLKGGLETDKFSYPRAGTPNAVSRLTRVRVISDADNNLSCSSEPVSGLDLGEYLVRVEWTTGGEALLVQAMSRSQDSLRLLAYLPVEGANQQPSVSLLEETAPPNRWIEVHDLLRPLSVSTADRTASLIWASEESGFRHLYHVTCSWLPGDSQAKSHRRQITFGNWQVQSDHLSVDVATGWLYFNSTILDPRCVQLCRVKYQPNHGSRVEVLTDAYRNTESFSTNPNKLALPKTCTGLVFAEQKVALLTVHCSHHSPEARLCSLSINDSLPTLALLTKAVGCNNFFLKPKYFEFTGPGGQLLYGLMFRPFNYQPGRQYPTLQYVYGGPHVQLVTNTFVGFNFHRVTKACYFGYCVLIVDNRGSDNRGRDFAAEVHHRLGGVELPDQVAGLQFAAKKFGCIDLNRVGLFGWSYGGYLTLLGMRDFNNVYKVGIAGAPVTDWELYDTAYTERYMGLPDGPAGCYNTSSAINSDRMSGYPSDANRLLIVHGSIDENVHFYHTAMLLNKLVAAGKPYSLLIYPSERHGLRTSQSKDHFETCLMHFLCQNL